jgi:outer membrane protein
MKNVFLSLLAIILISVSAIAQEEEEKKPADKKWQARFRMIAVNPTPHASIETIKGDVEISTSVVPEFDFTYFFNKNWALELILATANHDVKAVSTLAGSLELGDVWILPPTLTFQYHFNGKNVRPYLGAGINYTIFYGADGGSSVNNISYDNAAGFALQGGVDINLKANSDKWFFNIDLKKIYLRTDATVDASSALGATVVADVKIDPYVIGVGFGMRF